MDSALTPDQWQRIETIFADALDRPPEQRADFLAAACANDPHLHHEVETLLRALNEADEFLLALDTEQAATLIDTVDETVDIGEMVGPYRLRREIGRGGMGVVYLAERADGQFEQQVALKVVKRGMDTDAILRRFLHERQILASLQHPNIARLLDGGMTEVGQPYFAMEYVEGEPLLDYCDRHCLSIQERLHLFQTVAEAVQYAHHNRVIHRDLKPSNILVTDDGHVKLLDFGIAKLLDDEAEGVTLQTELGLRPMTPEYAAPEQVLGEPVTTATDVYSLGVVLYELLAGQRPYRFAHRTPEEIKRVVTEEPPPQPSAVVQRTEQIQYPDGTPETSTPEQVGQARSTEPERLRRQLAGDLDTIVLMALRKAPQRRYAAAEAFAEDIRRYLNGYPVQARRDTLRYRTNSFVRRHKVGVTASIVVLFALLAGLGAALWQAQVAAQQARTATEVKDFALSLFELADPDIAQGQDVTAEELLRQGAARVEKELADQPNAQADMFFALGRINHKLDQADEAQRMFERALSQYRALYGPSHLSIAKTRTGLGNVAISKGAYETARTHFEAARDIFEHAHGEARDSLLGDVFHDLAVLARREGHNQKAERLHRRALALRTAAHGSTHPSVAQSHKDLALVLHAQGRYDEAETLYRTSLASHVQSFGEMHRRVATSLNSLASLLRTQGKYAEAESLYVRSLRISRTLFGDEHSQVATVLSNIGGLLLRQGRPAQAQRRMKEALTIVRKLHPPDHPSVATMLNGLATALRDQELYVDALSFYENALSIYRERLGASHHFTGIALTNLGTVRLGMGDLGSADTLFTRALTIFRDTLPSGHDLIAIPLVGLGRMHLAQQRPEAAKPLLHEALEIRRAKLGLTHPRTAMAENVYGACLSRLGHYDQAEPLLIASLRRLEEAYPASYVRVKTARRHVSAHRTRIRRD